MSAILHICRIDTHVPEIFEHLFTLFGRGKFALYEHLLFQLFSHIAPSCQRLLDCVEGKQAQNEIRKPGLPLGGNRRQQPVEGCIRDIADTSRGNCEIDRFQVVPGVGRQGFPLQVEGQSLVQQTNLFAEIDRPFRLIETDDLKCFVRLGNIEEPAVIFDQFPGRNPGQAFLPPVVVKVVDGKIMLNQGRVDVVKVKLSYLEASLLPEGCIRPFAFRRSTIGGRVCCKPGRDLSWLR